MFWGFSGLQRELTPAIGKRRWKKRNEINDGMFGSWANLPTTGN